MGHVVYPVKPRRDSDAVENSGLGFLRAPGCVGAASFGCWGGDCMGRAWGVEYVTVSRIRDCQ